MKRKAAIIIPIIFIFSAAVFWFFRSQKAQAPVVAENTSVQSNQEKKQEPEAISDKEANWLEFKNIKFGYSLKFPRDWFVYDSDLADVFVQPRDEKLNEDFNDAHAMSLEIKVIAAGENSDIDSLIASALQEETKTGRTINKEKMKISRQDGYEVMVCGKFECGLEKWFVLKGGNLYYLNSRQGFMPEFDQIVTSTFKFIE